MKTCNFGHLHLDLLHIECVTSWLQLTLITTEVELLLPQLMVNQDTVIYLKKMIFGTFSIVFRVMRFTGCTDNFCTPEKPYTIIFIVFLGLDRNINLVKEPSSGVQ